MTLVELARAVFTTAEDLEIPYMAVGALAAGVYGIPRATKDLDLLVSVDAARGIKQLLDGLGELVEFDQQTLFDTITWGRRHVGVSRKAPPFKVELFEMFDDPFVESEFSRRVKKRVPILGLSITLPTAEDVVVQKVRWGRVKDLEDVKDILAVQTPAGLDMDYIRYWCGEHETTGRLEKIIGGLRG
ncbi:MAG: hypothetical protein EOP87_01645 [Verrucomicrobiaceae bacterium]|nr:MAG: hypothetical protein EOP87_01645 [Verrucomicrobiaceae bacterium]